MTRTLFDTEKQVQMKRLGMIFAFVLMISSIGLGGLAAFQGEGDSNSSVDNCATPVASPASPVADASPVAATPAASPVANDPCATPEADAAADVVVVELVDIAFVQNEITIPADTDVTFEFINKGSLQHDFKIDDPEVFSGILNSGEEAEVTVNLPAGEYEFYCSIPGHREGGMVGTLIVE